MSLLKNLRNVGAHFVAAVKDFKGVASVFPSSRFAIRSIVAPLGAGSDLIVEYGPGTGVVTRGILKRISSQGRVVAVEANALFAPDLQNLADARLVLLHGRVPDVLPDVRAILPDGAHAVFSGIPFSLIPPDVRESIVKATYELLKPGGKFIVYQNSRLMVPVLRRYFDEVDVSFEPRNIFPYFIMVGTRAKR